MRWTEIMLKIKLRYIENIVDVKVFRKLNCSRIICHNFQTIRRLDWDRSYFVITGKEISVVSDTVRCSSIKNSKILILFTFFRWICIALTDEIVGFMFWVILWLLHDSPYPLHLFSSNLNVVRNVLFAFCDSIIILSSFICVSFCIVKLTGNREIVSSMLSLMFEPGWKTVFRVTLFSCMFHLVA